MRMLLAAAGLVVSLGLSACQPSHSDAQAPAPAPKKAFGRSQVMYQGQEPIVQVTAVSIEPGAKPDSLILKATGQAAGPGYTDAVLLPRIYPAPPPDGIYEFDVVATRPAGAAAGPTTPTPIEVKGDWAHYPQARLKGVEFFAKTNQMTATAPPAK